MYCNTCPRKREPLIRSRYTYRPGKGKQCDLLIIGEAGGVEEVKQELAFVGETGQFVNKLLERALPGARVVLDNACACNLDEGHGKPTTQDIKHCRNRLEALIADIKPRAILLFGEWALRVAGIKRKPVAANGRIVSFLGIPAVCSVHPAYVLRNPGQVKLLEAAFISVKAILSKDDMDIQEIDTVQGMKAVLYSPVSRMSLDLETTGLDPKNGRILTAAIGREGKAYWFNLTEPSMLKVFLKWWRNYSGTLVIHNWGFEYHWWKHHVAKGRSAPIFTVVDTMLQGWLYNENISSGLDVLATHYLQVKPWWLGLEDVPQVAESDLQKVGEYNAKDALATLRLAEFFDAHLSEYQRNYHDRILVPMAKILVDMTDEGIHLNKRRAGKLIKETQAEIDSLESGLLQQFPDLNMRSAKQMRKLLYEDLGLDTSGIGVTSTGELTTSKKALRTLAKQHEIPAAIEQVRKLKTRLSTGLNPLLELADSDSLIHTQFNIGFVVTGRLSSSRPNMQNVEREGPVRSVFVSKYKGGSLVEGDMQQHELRMAAIMSGDAHLKAIFTQGLDPHQMLADKIGVTRQVAKALNFGLIGGESAGRIAEELEISYAEAKKVRRDWFKVHKGVAEWSQRIISTVKRTGRVTDFLGRTRHLPEAMLDDEYAGRSISQALNATIQSSGAGTVYLIMIEIDRMLRAAKLKSRIVLQVHDSVVVDCPPGEAKQVVKIMHEAVKSFDFGIPLAIDTRITKNLGKEK